MSEDEPLQVVDVGGKLVPFSYCTGCKRVGTKVEAVYWVDGLPRADPYCGWCGRNWKGAVMG